jgi:glycosyltransferase involved in cell wall biosynthesis
MTAMIARLFGMPLIVRTFGGGGLGSDAGNSQANTILRALRKADLYLGQTRKQVEDARAGGIARVEWFPTNRPIPRITEAPVDSGNTCRRFVFMSHVKGTKGILELIAAGERFGEDVAIDVYGPFRQGMTKEAFGGCRRVRYCGVVDPDRVIETLREYDALLLPTYHPGEGYPGIVIEAYAAGLPVICSRWRHLPEIVDDSSGLLIEPRSADALYDAMKHLTENTAYYRRLRQGVLEKREEFDTANWTDRFVQFCRESVGNHRTRRDNRYHGILGDG